MQKISRFVALALVLVTASVGVVFAQTAPLPPSSLHVVLLQATNAEVPAPANLPPSVVAGMKGAIGPKPFKAFRVLDQAVIRAQGSAATRLKGPGAREFVLACWSAALNTSNANETAVVVHLFATSDGVFERTDPEVLWAEFNAKPGEGAVVWTADEKTPGVEPLVLLVTPLTRELAMTFLKAPAGQALESVTGLLGSDCAAVVDSPAAGAVPSKTTRVRAVDGALLFDVVPTAYGPAGPQKPRAYRFGVGDVGVPSVQVSFGPRSDDPFTAFAFTCGTLGCVTINGEQEGDVRIRVCADKVTEFLKAMQFVVIQAGGRWQ